jgi:hypothetical protein
MDKERKNRLDEISNAIYASAASIVKKGANMQPPDVEVLNKAVCTIEKLKTIELLEEQIDFMAKYGGDGYSFGTGAMRYYDNNMRQNYSGHSVHDRMIAALEKVYDEIHSDYEKQQLRNEIRHIQNAN